MHVTRGHDCTREYGTSRVVLVFTENGTAALDARDLGLRHLVGGQPVILSQAVLHSRVVRREACDARLRLLGATAEALGENLGVARRVGGRDHRSDRKDREERDQDDAQQLSHCGSPSFLVVRDREVLPDRVGGLGATLAASHTAIPPF